MPTQLQPFALAVAVEAGHQALPKATNTSSRWFAVTGRSGRCSRPVGMGPTAECSARASVQLLFLPYEILDLLAEWVGGLLFDILILGLVLDQVRDCSRSYSMDGRLLFGRSAVSPVQSRRVARAVVRVDLKFEE